MQNSQRQIWKTTWETPICKTPHQNLVSKLTEIGAIQYGNFTLKSGQVTNVYFDLRKIYSYTDIFEDVVDQIIASVGDEFNLVCGVPTAGIPYATLYSAWTKVPMILLRSERKDHGTMKMIEGVFKPGQRVLLLEDVTTTGTSILKAKNDLEAEGLIVAQIATIIDRRVDTTNLSIKSILKSTDIVKNVNIRNFPCEFSNKLWKIVTTKKTNLCFSCDVDDIFLLESVAPYICMVKLHRDITNAPCISFVKELAEIYNFLILDDRKYADIGHIVKQQSLPIDTIACTSHSIFGQSTINGLVGNVSACFLVAQASTKDNLITPEYTAATLKLGQVNRQFVAGFISQKNLGDDSFLYMTPGVNLTETKDNMGQQYKTVVETDCDVIIVGRGIYESSEYVASAIAYRDAGWQALRRRFPEL